MVPTETGNPETSEYSVLEEAFGLPLLAYLCATTESSMRMWLDDAAHDQTLLSPQAQSVVIGTLLPLARHFSARPQEHRAWDMRVLISPVGDSSDCLGSALRRQAGGVLFASEPDAVGADRVKDLLVRMAVDVFPVLIAPESSDRAFSHVSLYQHPLRDDLVEAVHGDPILARLYSQEHPGLGRGGYLVDSFGRGRTTQDLGFAEEVLLAAWDMVRMAKANPDVADFGESVGQNLGRVREAVEGGSPVVPVKLVFTGFRAREGAIIHTPWGTLRPIREWEREFVPSSLNQSVSGKDDSGQQVLVSYGGEMVLDMAVPYRVEVGDFTLPGRSGDDGFSAAVARLSPRPSLSRVKDAVALALIMSVQRPSRGWVVSRLAWIWRADPMGRGYGVSGWNDTQQGPGFMPYELSTDDCAAMERWCDLIAQRWTGDLDVAVSRLLSAADDRLNAADRLVDAVIVWEALFGTRQGESALRISAAMAWLLADADVVERTQLRSEISKIYNERSGLVHGRTHDERSLQALANRSLELARDSLKLLMEERPDLLDLRGDNGERSVRLLLGG